MRALTTRTHAILDYAVGSVLVASPWLLGFGTGTAAEWVPVAAGVVLLAYSLATDYELGMVHRIQMTVHLWLDGIVGLVLAISPWLFEFDRQVWVPHVVAGVALVVLSLFSQTIPGYERRRAAR